MAATATHGTNDLAVGGTCAGDHHCGNRPLSQLVRVSRSSSSLWANKNSVNFRKIEFRPEVAGSVSLLGRRRPNTQQRV
jgi:hypothetical protein